jgi:hypothetical protein
MMRKTGQGAVCASQGILKNTSGYASCARGGAKLLSAQPLTADADALCEWLAQRAAAFIRIDPLKIDFTGWRT